MNDTTLPSSRVSKRSSGGTPTIGRLDRSVCRKFSNLFLLVKSRRRARILSNPISTLPERKSWLTLTGVSEGFGAPKESVTHRGHDASSLAFSSPQFGQLTGNPPSGSLSTLGARFHKETHTKLLLEANKTLKLWQCLVCQRLPKLANESSPSMRRRMANHLHYRLDSVRTEVPRRDRLPKPIAARLPQRHILPPVERLLFLPGRICKRQTPRPSVLRDSF